MIEFLAFVTVLFTICIIFLIVDWSIHVSMVNSETNLTGWAGFRKFKKYFDEVEWNGDHNKLCLYSPNYIVNKNKFHVGIITFDGKGMKIHNPFSYLMVLIYVHSYWKKNFKSNLPKESRKVKW